MPSQKLQSNSNDSYINMYNSILNRVLRPRNDQ